MSQEINVMPSLRRDRVHTFCQKKCTFLPGGANLKRIQFINMVLKILLVSVCLIYRYSRDKNNEIWLYERAEPAKQS